MAKRVKNVGHSVSGARNDFIELIGDVELAEALKQLSDAAAGKVMLPAIRKALPIAKKEAKRLVRKRSGALRRAIASKARYNKRKGIAWGMLYIRRDKEIVYNGKPHDPFKIAHLVEYGTVARANDRGSYRGYLKQNKSFLRASLGNKRQAISDAMTKEAFIRHEGIAKKVSRKSRRRVRR